MTSPAPYAIMSAENKRKEQKKVEELIAKYMKKYGITREEALSLIADDEATDKMSASAINKEMTPEQRKAQKAMTITTSGNKIERKREHKVNNRKKWFIEVLKGLLDECAEQGQISEVNVTNNERSIDFINSGFHYTVTLTEHRKPK